ncbi:MAG TPA: hypothetical protein VHZ29_13150 [Rhizomicrobium sp.]|nr:hypothetical protein [Rhizomicrobium sp.]
MKRFVVAMLLVASPAGAGDRIDLGHQGAPYAQVETDKRLVAERVEIFRKELRGMGFTGALQSCSRFVVLTGDSRDSNRGFGADCMLDVAPGKTRRIIVCDDEMLGGFALTLTDTPDAERIAVSTEQNCFEG